jgi:hypothetical protein
MRKRLVLVLALGLIPLVGVTSAEEGAAAREGTFPESAKGKDPFFELDLDEYAREHLERVVFRAPEPWDEDHPALRVSRTRFHQILQLSFPASPNWLVEVTPRSDEVEYEVQQVAQPTISVCDDEDCLTLLSWAQRSNDWRNLEHQEGRGYQMIDAWREGDLWFPEFTSDEARQAADREARDLLTDDRCEPDRRWGALAALCKSAESPPCTLVVGRYLVNIRVRIEDEWEDLVTFQVIPAGGD